MTIRCWVLARVAAAAVLVPSLAVCADGDVQTQKAPQRSFLGATTEPGVRLRATGFKWDHEIRVAVPAGYDKADTSYPVLWVTDASWMFDTAVATVNGFEAENVPKMIVVGIGVPPGEEDEYARRRFYDFVPKLTAQELQRIAPALSRIGASSGGAEEFLTFMTEKVRPALSTQYRMNGEHTLYGYSAGGMFCGYVLLTRPRAFDRYICGGVGGEELLGMEEAYSQAHDDLRAKLFFGSADSDILERGVPFAHALLQRKYPSLEMQIAIFPDEDHGSAVPLLMSKGLRAVWKDARK